MAGIKSAYQAPTASTVTGPRRLLRQAGGAPTEPFGPAQQRSFFEKLRPARRAHGDQTLARPAPSASGGKPRKINMLGGRRFWRNAKSHANQQQNVRATLDAIAAGVLCTAGVGVHYTSRAVGAAIRHANKKPGRV